jgi:hypothetical protein
MSKKCTFEIKETNENIVLIGEDFDIVAQNYAFDKFQKIE